MKNKLFIFDMDGVLVDACEWHRVALNESLREISNYEISLEEHYSIFNGIPTKVKLNMLKDKKLIEQEDIEKIENLKQLKTISIIENMCNIRKEKIDLLSVLKNKNYQLACYTNSIRKTALLMLEKTGIINFFDLIITNEDVKKPKPDPEGYIKIINHFNMDKKDVYIIEDSEKGYQAAKDSGANVIRVDNPDFVDLKLLELYI